MNREELARYLRDEIGNNGSDLYWFNIADYVIQKVEEAERKGYEQCCVEVMIECDKCGKKYSDDSEYTDSDGGHLGLECPHCGEVDYE